MGLLSLRDGQTRSGIHWVICGNWGALRGWIIGCEQPLCQIDSIRRRKHKTCPGWLLAFFPLRVYQRLSGTIVSPCVAPPWAFGRPQPLPLKWKRESYKLLCSELKKSDIGDWDVYLFVKTFTSSVESISLFDSNDAERSIQILGRRLSNGGTHSVFHYSLQSIATSFSRPLILCLVSSVFPLSRFCHHSCRSRCPLVFRCCPPRAITHYHWPPG